MKKVGIVTFHASHNYGSCLQAYSLQHAISDLGFACEIINFRTDIQKEIYKVFTNRKGLKFILKNLYTLLFIYDQRKEKYEKFENFINGEMNLSKEINTVEEFEKVVSDYDYIVTGSDQIWNVEAEDYSLAYMLPFEGKRKISYAVSTGENMSAEVFSAKEAELIKEIDYLSVRDTATKEMIRKVADKEAAVVLDPTMLYNEDFYDKFVEETPLIKGKYIYLYTLGNDKNLLETAKILSRKTNLPIYISHVSGTHYMFGLKKALAAGPKEFLNHIKFAEYVVTSSFHATIFSILFKKQFWSYNALKDNRRRELLTKTGLLSRSVNKDDCENKLEEIISVEKYNQVFRLIEEERKSSSKFLQTALGE